MAKVFKGNNAYFTFTRKSAGGSPITTEPRGLFFTVKKNYEDDDFVIQKTLGNGITSLGSGRYRIEILPIDTDNLDFGKYCCDIKVVDENGLKFTILNPQEFTIMKVVTRSGDES